MMEEFKSVFGGKKIARKKRAYAVLLVFVAIFLFGNTFAQAQVNTGLTEFAQYTALAQTDIRIIIAKIIRAFLGILGIVAICLTIYGGYMYMTSEGNETKVEAAKNILKNMVIGLVIILSAFGITQFIINMLTGEYRPGGTTITVPPPPAPWCSNCGYLGSIMESHYPGRDAIDIPRNTKIVITFKQKIKPESLFVENNGSAVLGDVVGGAQDKINTNNIKIFKTEDGENNFLGLDPNDTKQFIFATLTADHRTIVIKPKESLGDGLKEYKYTVKLLGGSTGIKVDDGSTNGRDAFTGINNYYDWSFTVSTFLDLTPPYVTSIIPLPSSVSYPRNTLVQINFSEPVDPLSASGIISDISDFNNITITTSSGGLVHGEYKIGNQYKTIEFVSDNLCGKNPCGQPIYCLPANQTVTTTVKSASVGTQDTPQAVLYDGVMDLASNSLNGGGEFKLSGSGYSLLPGLKTEEQWKANTTAGKFFDNYFWSFTTKSAMDVTAPKIRTITPNYTDEKINVNAPVDILFNKPMAVTTFSSILLRNKYGEHDVGYMAGSKNYNSSHVDISQIDPSNYSNDPDDHDSIIVSKTRAILYHGDFYKAPEGSALAPIYMTFATSLVTDIFQNCYYPAENIATGSECVKTIGQIDDTNMSCYDNIVSSSTSTCSVGEACYLHIGE